jgi:uncharacterized repeat protein (TIGR01451 family)
VGDLVNCSSAALQITAVVGASGLYTNAAEVTALNEDDPDSVPGDGMGDDHDTATTTPITPADVSIAKTVTPGQATSGQSITYTLAFSNTGMTPATGVVITDLVPITLTQVSYTHSGAPITPTAAITFAWQVADLGSRHGGLISITGIVDPSVSGLFRLTNKATITTTATDGNPDNNTSVVSSIVGVSHWVCMPVVLRRVTRH